MSVPTEPQPDHTIENLKAIIKNQEEHCKDYDKLTEERETWIREKANIYMDLGELEVVLDSKVTPSQKVKKCREIIKLLNDPYHLEEMP